MRIRYGLCDLSYEYESMDWNMFWLSFKVWWENEPMKCLWFMKEICVESMNMKVKVRWS
jgi:hypothetical protein